MNEFVNGKYTPYYRVENNPTNMAPHIIQALNTDTFEKAVMAEDKDVFVMFLSAECKLCEDFWPVFVQAAKAMHKNTELVFASINMELNELAEENVYFFPTIRYYPINSKHRPYDYDQGLQLREVIGFIRRVATHPDTLVEDYTTVLLDDDNKKSDL